MKRLYHSLSPCATCCSICVCVPSMQEWRVTDAACAGRSVLQALLRLIRTGFNGVLHRCIQAARHWHNNNTALPLVCIHSCVYSPTPRDTYCATTPGNTSTSFTSAYKNSLDGEILFGAQNVLESSVLTLIIIAFVYIGGRCESLLPHESKRRLSPSATPNPRSRHFQTYVHRCILRLRKQLRCMACPGRSSAELERKM